MGLQRTAIERQPHIFRYYTINTTQRYRETEKNINPVSQCLYVDSDIRCIILSVAQFVTKEDKR